MDTQRCYGCMKQKTRQICEHCGYDPQTKNAPHQLAAGTTLQGRYLIGKVLGQGGFGITYLGWDSMLEVPVAIKEYFPGGMVMRDNFQTSAVTSIEGKHRDLFEKNRERFLREAKTLVKFSNVPEIVHILNLFMENNTAYIVMEYVEGVTMKDYVASRGGHITAYETFAILKPVMEALSKVHEAGLVHRDISPDNIMMLPGGGAKLLDFGAVRDVGDADVDKVPTKSTEAILKHGFAPIEQYQSRGGLGPWTDVYALCATIYYCLTGRIPADAPLRVMEDADVDWYQVPGLTNDQVTVMEKGMALAPKLRIRTVAQLYEGLFGKAVPGQQTSSFSEKIIRTEHTAEAKPADTKLEQYPVGTIPLHGDMNETAPGKTVPLDRSKDRTVDVTPVKEEKAPRKETQKENKRRPAGLIAAVLLVAMVAGGVLLFMGGKEDNKPAVHAPWKENSSPKDVTSPVATEEEVAPAAIEKIRLLISASAADLENERSFLPVACEKFAEAHPEWEIEFDFVSCETADAASVISKNPAAAADVYMYSYDQLDKLLQAGALARLDGAALEQVLVDNFDVMIDTVTSGAGIYGVPYSGNTWFMYYRKSCYTEETVKSLETMMATKPVSFPVTNSWYLPAFFYANGCTMFGDGADDYAGFQLGGKAGAEAALYIADALQSGRMVDGSDGHAREAFIKREVGAYFSGSWEADILQEALGDDLGIAQPPCITVNGQQKQLYAFANSQAIGVNPHSEHPAAAAALAVWLGSAEMQKLHYQMGSAYLPSSKTLLETGVYSDDALVLAHLNTLAHASKMQPVIPEMAHWWDAGTKMGEDLVKGRINSQNVSRTVNDWNDAMNKNIF